MARSPLRPSAVLSTCHLHFPGESVEYRGAWNALLAEEMELRRQIERVAAQRRKHRHVPFLTRFEFLLHANVGRQTRRVAEIVAVIAVAGGRQQTQPVPAAFLRKVDNTRQRRLRDHRQVDALKDVLCLAVERIEKMRASRARPLPFGPYMKL